MLNAVDDGDVAAHEKVTDLLQVWQVARALVALLVRRAISQRLTAQHKHRPMLQPLLEACPLRHRPRLFALALRRGCGCGCSAAIGGAGRSCGAIPIPKVLRRCCIAVTAVAVARRVTAGLRRFCHAVCIRVVRSGGLRSPTM